MSRYLIVDLDKAAILSDLTHMHVEALKKSKACLSEEETMAKFKSVYEAGGASSGAYWKEYKKYL